MARPKRKVSRRVKGLRSAHHAVKQPNVIQCPNCQENTVSHRVCPNCGYYKGKEVVAQEEE